MRLWNHSMTRLMLALPAPAMVAGTALADPLSVAAQTITPAELVGSWLSRPSWQVPDPDPDSLGAVETIWTYGADKTVRTSWRWKGGAVRESGDTSTHWVLHGDTLITFHNAADTLPTRPSNI